MTNITLTFVGTNWGHVRQQMYDALGLDHPAQASTAPADFPDEPEKTTLGQIFDEEEAKAEAAPAPAPAAPRSHKKKPPATTTAPATPSEPEVEPVPAQAPAPVQTRARELPPLDALKATVTQAVRQAQKGDGPKTILDLLPGFKAKTGLNFVMEASDVHRAALADLIDAAGISDA